MMLSFFTRNFFLPLKSLSSRFILLFVLQVAFFQIVNAQNPAPFLKEIPTPLQHFGFNIGDNYKLANYSQTESYFKKLAAASNRINMVEMGKTEEGRSQYMLIVSHPDNLAKLEFYREISVKLARAENLSEADARKLAATGKPVVWIDGGLHSNEMVATHQLIETAYQLSSRTDDETINILKNTIILLVHANPDGQELVANWYMRKEDSTQRAISQIPRLYEKYAGHDNNRDFFMLNLKETQNMGKNLFLNWIPQIMYNHHQSGPPGSIVAGAPYRDPFNYVFDPLLITSLDAVGAAMNNRLNAEGKPGYTQRNGASFSTWYNGGLRTTTYFHNMIGLLTEIVGNPTPMEIPLIPSRLIPNGATPNPVTPQKWLFRQSIDYSISLNYAVLNYAVRHGDELLFHMYRMGKNSIEKGSKDHWTLSPSLVQKITDTYNRDLAKEGNNRNSNSSSAPSWARNSSIPSRYFDSVLAHPKYRDARAYVIPKNQTDAATAVKFLNALIKTGVRVHQATATFSLAGKSYPKGSWVVLTNQAFRPHILDMFEPQDHPNDLQYPGGPPIPPYDAAGWTLAFLMGVEFDRYQVEVTGPFEALPYGEEISLNLFEVEEKSAFHFPTAANNSYLLINLLLKNKIPVYRDGNNFYFQNTGNNTEKFNKLLKDFSSVTGVELKATEKKNTNSLSAVKPLNIALWDTYGGSMPSGWIRFILEKFSFDFEVIYPAQIEAGGLRKKFDVVILPGGAIPSYAEGGRGNNSRNNSPVQNYSDIPKEYQHTLGRITEEKGIPALEAFLKEGGRVVAIGNSAQLAWHLKLPIANALTEINSNGEPTRLSNEKFFIPGSVLEVALNKNHPDNAGFPGNLDVYFQQSPVFRILPEAIASGNIQPLAWYAKNNPLRSGWALGEAYLSGGVAAFTAQVGNGKLAVFGPEITFRAQAHGTFKLLFQQLFN